MVCIAVVGEALLDVDVEGKVDRLSPEAPVPVLDDLVEHDRPGGAALAAAMAARDGHDVVLVTPLADDEAGQRLRAALDDGVEVIALPADGGTPVKKRVRSDGHNFLRLDAGGSSGTWGTALPEVDAALSSADVVLVSDYGRGLTADPHCRYALTRAAARVPLVWDPHPRGADPVEGTLVLTPNRSELDGRIGSPDDVRGSDHVRLAAQQAVRATHQLTTRAVAVTLGAHGALLSFGDGPPQVFTTSATSGDPCGAGDRFAATLAVSLAGDSLLSQAVQAAVLAATDHVAAGGAAAFGRDEAEPVPMPSDAQRLAERVRATGGTLVATGGCFDLLHAGHVEMLGAARSLGDRLVVLLNSDDSVRRLKGDARPLMSAEDRVRVLTSLECVDAVLVFDEDTPSDAIARLRPDIWVKGGDYAGTRLPEEDVLATWGGQAVVVPYLQGRSTSALVRAMSTP